MTALYVLYDETCGFCCRCADWLRRQPAYVELIILPAGSRQVAAAFPGLARAGDKQELIVVGSDGAVFRNSDAWLMVIWALKAHREWASRLSSPALKPLARNAFEFLSSNRKKVSEWFGLQSEAYVAKSLEDWFGAPGVPKCGGESCEVPATKCAACGKQVPRGREYCPYCLAGTVKRDAHA